LRFTTPQQLAGKLCAFRGIVCPEAFFPEHRLMAAPRVLVVEDDAALAAGIVSGLRQAGFEVELLTHGGEVARRVLGGPFDAVVLDLMLPERSGLEVLAELRERSSVPILVLTARTELEDRLQSSTSTRGWCGSPAARPS
jgi:CheY-like chemotaxis protein